MASASPSGSLADSSGGGALAWLAQVDVFPKVEDAYQARTRVGGLATALVGTALAMLVLAELAAYRAEHVVHQFVVDTTGPQPLAVNLDITIGIECQYITLLLWDHSGAVSHDLSQRVRLEPQMMNVLTLGPVGASDFLRSDVADGTLHDKIKRAAHFRQNPIRALLPVGGASTDDSTGVLKGCRMHGSFAINKVAGRLQIMAQGHGQGMKHTPHEALNFTHRINGLSFGATFPGIVNPLDGQVEVSHEAFQMYQYFISVVPTTYVDSSGNTLFTNQYAVTQYNRVVNHDKGSHGIPGIMLKFDVEPLLVRISAEPQSILHLLVRLSGVVGGVFVCMGLVKFTLDWIALKALGAT